MTASFGQVIPVTGPNIGFPGAVSRFGERVIASREFTPFTTSNNLLFGSPAVELYDQTGGKWDSVADFVAHAVANIGLVASQFAGFAVREVKTTLGYPNNPDAGVVGYYSNAQMADVLERGSMTVQLAVGSPNAGDKIYTRVVLNGAVPAGTIGDIETNPVATDLFTTTATAAAGATAVTLASGTNTVNNQVISGQGFAPGTYIVSGGGTTSIVVSQATVAAVAAGTVVTISNLVALPDTVARTGFVDANNMLEITIKRRVAA